MTIQIKQDSKSEWVTVVWNDYCDHAGAEMQTIDFGYPGREKADWVDDIQDVLVCDKCEEIIE